MLIGVKSSLESKGILRGFDINYQIGKARVVIDLDTTELGDIETLKDMEVKVNITKWRDKRSLTANAYFHTLSDKLADATRMSKPECKNYLLYHYGQKLRDADGKLVVLKTNANEKELLNHKDFHFWHFKTAEDGTPMYVMLRHSSSFDSREMSILIDGVIEECKAWGIETLPPQEVERLKRAWDEVNSTKQ